MNELITRLPEERPPRQLRRAAQAQSDAELTIFTRGLAARVEAECDQIYSQAVADVVRSAMREDMETFDYGMELANGSVAKIEITAQYTALQSRISSNRIARRFGA